MPCAPRSHAFYLVYALRTGTTHSSSLLFMSFLDPDFGLLYYGWDNGRVARALRFGSVSLYVCFACLGLGSSSRFIGLLGCFVVPSPTDSIPRHRFRHTYSSLLLLTLQFQLCNHTIPSGWLSPRLFIPSRLFFHVYTRIITGTRLISPRTRIPSEYLRLVAHALCCTIPPVLTHTLSLLTTIMNISTHCTC